jgi:uncharacterized DUF497 family protein
MVRLFKKLQGFLWDDANREKNQVKHKVTGQEAEEVFFDSSYLLLKDILHSGKEHRFNIIGVTKTRRLLAIAFTVRNNLVRIISARPTSRRERALYEKTSKTSKI